MADGADNYCPLLANNKLPHMNHTARHETCCYMVHKIITSLNSKHYQPSGMLIHWQNSYAPRKKQWTGRHETQSCEPINRVKIFLVLSTYDFGQDTNILCWKLCL
jgi:hypothetical protein